MKRHKIALLLAGPLLIPLSGCAGMLSGRAECDDSGAASRSPGASNPGAGGSYGHAGSAQDGLVRTGGHSADCRRPCDFSPCAIPAPPGTYVNGWNEAQIAEANRNDFLISRHEWFSGGDQLGPEALRHVAGLPALMAHCPEPVVIEAAEVEIGYDETYEQALTRTSQLNVARRDVVVQNLLSRGVADAEARVIVDDVERVGVYGVESPLIYTRLLRGGQQGQGGGGMGGGLGGGGLGGGGFGGGGGGGGFF